MHTEERHTQATCNKEFLACKEESFGLRDPNPGNLERGYKGTDLSLRSPQVLDVLPQVVQLRDLHLLLDLQRVRLSSSRVQRLHDDFVDDADELLIVFEVLFAGRHLSAVVANGTADGAEATEQVADARLLRDKVLTEALRLLRLEIELKYVNLVRKKLKRKLRNC